MGNTSSSKKPRRGQQRGRGTAQEPPVSPQTLSTLSPHQAANVTPERLSNIIGQDAAAAAAAATTSRTAGESGSQLTSSLYSYGRVAHSARSTYSVRWKDGVVDTSPVPPKPIPKPPPKPPRTFVAAAATSPVLEGVKAQLLPRAAPSPPPLPSSPKPRAPPPPRRSLLAAAASGRVRIATATSATQQPPSQRQNQGNSQVPAAANAPTKPPTERQRRRKQLQSGHQGDAQPRRLDATSDRPLPRMLDEALDDETLLAIRRLAAERKSSRRWNSHRFGRRAISAASSFSVRWGGDLLGADVAAVAAEVAPTPQPFSTNLFDPAADAAAEDERRRECELRRAEQELYDAELNQRTCVAAAAAALPSASARFHHDGFSVEASAATAVHQSTTSATAVDWGASRPAASGRAAGGDNATSGGRSGLSGLPLCGRMQPEARYYDSRPVVPK